MKKRGPNFDCKNNINIYFYIIVYITSTTYNNAKNVTNTGIG